MNHYIRKKNINTVFYFHTDIYYTNNFVAGVTWQSRCRYFRNDAICADSNNNVCISAGNSI